MHGLQTLPNTEASFRIVRSPCVNISHTMNRQRALDAHARIHEKSQQIIKSAGLFNCGRGGGIRTHDPLLPKQMRYQAALRPDKTASITQVYLQVAEVQRDAENERIVTAVPGAKPRADTAAAGTFPTPLKSTDHS